MCRYSLIFQEFSRTIYQLCAYILKYDYICTPAAADILIVTYFHREGFIPGTTNALFVVGKDGAFNKRVVDGVVRLSR